MRKGAKRSSIYVVSRPSRLKKSLFMDTGRHYGVLVKNGDVFTHRNLQPGLKNLLKAHRGHPSTYISVFDFHPSGIQETDDVISWFCDSKLKYLKPAAFREHFAITLVKTFPNDQFEPMCESIRKYSKDKFRKNYRFLTRNSFHYCENVVKHLGLKMPLRPSAITPKSRETRIQSTLTSLSKEVRYFSGIESKNRPPKHLLTLFGEYGVGSGISVEVYCGIKVDTKTVETLMNVPVTFPKDFKAKRISTCTKTLCDIIDQVILNQIFTHYVGIQLLPMKENVFSLRRRCREQIDKEVSAYLTKRHEIGDNGLRVYERVKCAAWVTKMIELTIHTCKQVFKFGCREQVRLFLESGRGSSDLSALCALFDELCDDLNLKNDYGATFALLQLIELLFVFESLSENEVIVWLAGARELVREVRVHVSLLTRLMKIMDFSKESQCMDAVVSIKNCSSALSVQLPFLRKRMKSMNVLLKRNFATLKLTKTALIPLAATFLMKKRKKRNNFYFVGAKYLNARDLVLPISFCIDQLSNILLRIAFINRVWPLVLPEFSDEVEKYFVALKSQGEEENVEVQGGVVARVLPLVARGALFISPLIVLCTGSWIGRYFVRKLLKFEHFGGRDRRGKPTRRKKYKR